MFLIKEKKNEIYRIFLVILFRVTAIMRFRDR